MDLKREIKEFANRQGWSDVEPFEVVRRVSDRTVEVRPMAVSNNLAEMKFLPGGFVAHCVNNYEQRYEYSSMPDAGVIRIRWSERKRRWQDRWGNVYFMSDRPRYFYDYNF